MMNLRMTGKGDFLDGADSDQAELKWFVDGVITGGHDRRHVEDRVEHSACGSRLRAQQFYEPGAHEIGEDPCSGVIQVRVIPMNCGVEQRGKFHGILEAKQGDVVRIAAVILQSFH